jgi:hypothetical protein
VIGPLGEQLFVISVQEFNRLCAGRFVALTLEGGPTLAGLRRARSRSHTIIRVDGLATEDDGTISQFSLRLERFQIQAASILPRPSVISDAEGQVYRMGSGFWEEIE